MNRFLILAFFYHFFYINNLKSDLPPMKAVESDPFIGGKSGLNGNRFPAISPNCSGMLRVDEVHEIYWEESGNPAGIPVLFLHGGPGVGTEEVNRTFFDPNFYRIILFDQRGCGKSTPNGCLINNTTWDLVEDINKLRALLSIDQCLLFGGSWGCTLALVYAIKYPENVLGLILRGIFLCRQQELNWFYREGANYLSPRAWKIFTECIPAERQSDLIATYHDDLHSDSYWTQVHRAAAWVLWEFANLQSTPDYRLKALLKSKCFFYIFAMIFAKQNKIQAQIENHYFFNKAFLETDNWILENIHNIKNVPGIIIQGESDQICPWENAAELHQNWPASNFILIPQTGHASSESKILEALIEATEEFKSLIFGDNSNDS